MSENEAQPMSMEMELRLEQQTNTRLHTAICAVGRELGLIMPERMAFFEEDALECIAYLKKDVRTKVTDDMEAHYVKEHPTPAGFNRLWVEPTEEHTSTHVVIGKRYWDGFGRMLGQFGIDQMSAAVDICMAALQWFEEDWDLGAPATNPPRAMADACARYNNYVKQRKSAKEEGTL